MEAVGAAASVIAVIDLSAKIARTCSQYIKEVKNAEDDVRRLQEEVNNLNIVLGDIRQLLEGADSTRLKSSQKLETALKRSVTKLQTLAAKLQNLEQKFYPGGTRYRIKSRLGFAALKWPFSSKETGKAIQDILQLKQTLSLAMQHDHLVVSLNSSQLNILGQLPVANGASFNSRDEEFNPVCLANTRVELLDQILAWVHDSNSKTIFWLNGMAGTGKSTISRTIARSLSGTGNLGASFFFKRGEADRGNTSKLITTIARQITDTAPRVAPILVSVIESDSTLLGSAIQEQFHKMIFEPLSNISLSAPFVLILDALDECEGDNEVRAIINLFARMQSLQSSLKVFITSRPDLPIRLGFSDIKNTYSDLILHQVEPQAIEHDLSVFIEYSFQSIREDYNHTVRETRRLPSDWPGQSKIVALVSITTPLFISAATACRFISDRRCGNPDRLLEEFLGHQNKSLNSGLSATYLPVLQRQIHGLSKAQADDVIQQFRYIVGTIVILASPLSTSSLAKLLDVLEDDVEIRLDMLHSVLHIPSLPTDPIRLLHLSFRDFLLAPETREETALAIDEKQMHRDTFVNCLRLLNTSLREDICDINSPGTSRFDISLQLIADCIPPELEYACLYWVEHLKTGNSQRSDVNEVLYLLSSHLLHWMEVLSLVARASEITKILRLLRSLPEVQKEEELLDLLDDAIRFSLTYMHAIDSYPLQLYTMIAFLPTKSHVKSLFSCALPTWLSVNGNMAKDWDSCLQILEGHRSPVYRIAVSPDSKRLASVSHDDGARLWDTETGQCLMNLPYDGETIKSAEFSPDLKFLATASWAGAIQLWDTETGQYLQSLKPKSGMAEFVVFTPDSRRIVSGSCGKDLQFWDLGTDQSLERSLDVEYGIISVVFSPNGKHLASVSGGGKLQLWDAEECHPFHLLEKDGIESAVFSLDSKYLASNSRYVMNGLDNNTVRLWNTKTGQCLKVLEGHSQSVRSMLFSPDSKLVASASGDCTVRLWDIETGECLQMLGKHSDWVRSLDFSPDAKRLVSSANDTITLWNVENGQCLQTLGGHGDLVESVLFSPEAKFFASGSRDKTIRIWNVEAHRDSGSQDYIHSISFTKVSSDSKLLASASVDSTIRIWDIETVQCLHTLEVNGTSIRFMEFSPDSKRIAAASNEIVRVWDIGTYPREQILEGHGHWIDIVSFSPDSRYLASGSADQTLRVWDAETGQCVQTLTGHTASVDLVTFSANSKFVASSSYDLTIRLWDIETGECLHLLKGHKGGITSILFSSDSRLLASASADMTVRVWDTATGQSLQKLKHESEVRSTVFLANEKCLVSACDLHAIHLWHIKSGVSVQTLHVDTGCCRMSYSPEDSRLQIDAGTVTIDNSQSSYPCFKTFPGVDYPKLSGCGLDPDLCWILWNGYKAIWLPPSLRPESLLSVAVSGSRVVIGSVSGRVIVIRMSAH